MRFKVSQEERDKVMASLFVEEGVRFSLGRTPVACSDYSFGYYSYNDVKDDYTMRNFSIDRDRFILIPYIKEALKLRPDLKMWASPWTPPAWMKVNEHYSQKSSGIEGTDIGHNRLDPARNVLEMLRDSRCSKDICRHTRFISPNMCRLIKKTGLLFRCSCLKMK